MKKIVLCLIYVLISVTLVGLFGLVYLEFFNHTEKPKPANEYIEITYECVERPRDWKEQLRKLFNTPHSVVWEEFENKSRTGYTRLLSRKIHIDVSLNEIDETMTYAHELTHLKYFTANETFVTYQSIITLYESDIPYFRCVALKNANNIINYHSYKGTEYDCGWLLQQYFEKEINYDF